MHSVALFELEMIISKSGSHATISLNTAASSNMEWVVLSSQIFLSLGRLRREKERRKWGGRGTGVGKETGRSREGEGGRGRERGGKE